jgi:hypothetical protein
MATGISVYEGHFKASALRLASIASAWASSSAASPSSPSAYWSIDARSSACDVPGAERRAGLAMRRLPAASARNAARSEIEPIGQFLAVADVSAVATSSGLPQERLYKHSMLRPQHRHGREPKFSGLESEEANVAKIFSRDEYLEALRGDDEMKSQRGMTADEYQAPCAPPQAPDLRLNKRTGNRSSPLDRERLSRRRKAFRLLDAYAGQFY